MTPPIANKAKVLAGSSLWAAGTGAAGDVGKCGGAAANPVSSALHVLVDDDMAAAALGIAAATMAAVAWMVPGMLNRGRGPPWGFDGGSPKSWRGSGGVPARLPP